MMGKILIEADTETQKIQLMGSKCTNMDFCAVITSAVRQAAKGKMVTDRDVLIMAKALTYIAPECALKVMDEKPQRPKSKDFANLDDAMGMFDKLLRDTFGKDEGEDE